MSDFEKNIMMKRETFYGEIKVYMKGYGFITEYTTGQDYFFLKRDVGLKEEEILPHLPVSFSLLDDRDPETDKPVKRGILIREYVE